MVTSALPNLALKPAQIKWKRTRLISFLFRKSPFA